MTAIIKKETIMRMLNREITPNECKEIMGISNSENLLDIIKANKLENERKIRRLSFSNITKMNYLDINYLISKQKNKGLTTKLMVQELEYEWECGEISGFDYRYIVESMGCRPRKQFINHARNIGRYDK